MAAFDVRNPGFKEYVIVFGVTLGGFFVYEWVKNRNAPANTPSGTPAPAAAAVFSQPFQTTTSLRAWIVDHAAPPERKHREPGKERPDFTYARQVADGARSLDEIARSRHTSAGHIIDVTRKSPEISRKNLARFNRYVSKGTGRRMPPGLVFYTSNQGSGAGHENVGGGDRSPSNRNRAPAGA